MPSNNSLRSIPSSTDAMITVESRRRSRAETPPLERLSGGAAHSEAEQESPATLEGDIIDRAVERYLACSVDMKVLDDFTKHPEWNRVHQNWGRLVDDAYDRACDHLITVMQCAARGVTIDDIKADGFQFEACHIRHFSHVFTYEPAPDRGEHRLTWRHVSDDQPDDVEEPEPTPGEARDHERELIASTVRGAIGVWNKWESISKTFPWIYTPEGSKRLSKVGELVVHGACEAREILMDLILSLDSNLDPALYSSASRRRCPPGGVSLDGKLYVVVPIEDSGDRQDYSDIPGDDRWLMELCVIEAESIHDIGPGPSSVASGR